MSNSMIKTDAYVSKDDLFKVDPRHVRHEEGWNPRTVLDREKLDELKSSIKANGFYKDKPLLLRRDGNTVYLVEGHRRHTAVMELIDEGEPILSVFAVLETNGDPAMRLARALCANNNGEPLEPLDEARALQRLVEGFGWAIPQVAAKVGRSASHVRARLTLLEAAPEVLEAVRDKAITNTDAIKVVAKSKREGKTQKDVLDSAVQSRKNGKVRPEVVEDHDAVLMREILDGRGVFWVMKVILDYADSEEVLDAVHEVKAGAA